MVNQAIKMSAQSINALEYHQRTKHQLEAYARGPAGLDWDNQPNPFRHFSGCPQIALPLKARDLSSSYSELFLSQAIEPKPFSKENIAILCELAMGLSAWKVYGTDRWSLRCNPSSGNLHPSEGYLLLPEVDEIESGVYHYQSYDHTLEQRCKFEEPIIPLLPTGSFLMGLSSIHWREAWKYGERAYRYCQLDIGHLIGAIRYAAACLGWRITLLDNWDDEAVAALLGIDRQEDFKDVEPEAPDALLLVESITHESKLVGDIASFKRIYRNVQWQGQANVLSEQHEFDWPVIDQVNQACVKATKSGSEHVEANKELPKILLPDYLRTHKAAKLIQRRRSAQAFDGATSLSFSAFCRIMDAMLPRQDIPPFDATTLNTNIHLVLFVHRVEGLNPGMYCLPRSEQGETLLRQELSPQFQWDRVETIPDSIPLYLLVRAKCGNAAHTLSCHQAIAADSAFSLAMIAEFEKPMKEGDWKYRQLFWEAGLVGQSLYLEAEAANASGTGIGCYFDDKVHEILGIKNQRLQDLYHFTVGTPVRDARLATLPPYSHLESRDTK
jgi:SagB-type dehydrogenase family enzyme